MAIGGQRNEKVRSVPQTVGYSQILIQYLEVLAGISPVLTSIAMKGAERYGQAFGHSLTNSINPSINQSTFGESPSPMHVKLANVKHQSQERSVAHCFVMPPMDKHIPNQFCLTST